MCKRKFDLNNNIYEEDNTEIGEKKIKLDHTNTSELAETVTMDFKKIVAKKKAEAASKKLKIENSLKHIILIKELLKNVKSAGKCSVGGESTELPSMLGLSVKNYGNIKLPLDKNQADELIKLCHQAPYGLKYETLHDKAVRDTYQLDPSEIEIRNKSWDENLEKLVEKVAKDMGCKGKVQAKLYKMLLYEKGGHFKKHRDTEKEKGMFGTLIIQLPSIYTGGELVVYGSNDTKLTFDFGQSNNRAEFGVHYAAHYADLEHEILEVKSGYRLVLIYNLCWLDGNDVDSYFINESNQADKLANSLKALNETARPIALLLTHHYTQESFETNSEKALKGIDNDRFVLLKAANDRLNASEKSTFYAFRATLEKCDNDNYADGYPYFNYQYDTDSDDLDASKVESESDDNSFEDDETSSKKKRKEKKQRWSDLESNMEIEEVYDLGDQEEDFKYELKFSMFEQIIDPDIEHEIDLEYSKKLWFKDNVEYSGRTGNEGATRTTLYHKYLLAIYPNVDELDYLLLVDVNDAIRCALNSFESDSPATCANNLYRVIEHIIGVEYASEDSVVRRIEYENIKNMFEIICEMKDFRLARLFIDCLMNSNRFEKILGSLASLIQVFGWSSLKSELYKYFCPCTCENFSFICNLINDLIKQKNDNLALEVFSDLIAPLLNSENSFITQQMAYCWNLAKTVALVGEHSQFSDYQSKFIRMMVKAFQKENFKTFVEFILNELKGINLETFEHVKILIKFRVKFLKEALSKKPAFSWSMPNARIPVFPEVESFFHSEESNFVYTGYKLVRDAREFANIYGRSEDYSCNMSYGKVGKVVQLVINKTSDYYNKINREFDGVQFELDKIQKLNLNL